MFKVYSLINLVFKGAHELALLGSGLKFQVLMLLFPVFVFGQFTLTGKMFDSKTNELLQGGKIFIKNSYRVTATATNGYYSINNIKKGSYTVKATYIGYEPMEINLKINRDTIVNFQMVSSPVLTDEVIISATRATDKTPVAFENISGKEISDRNLGQDIPLVLENTPSAVVTSDAGAGVGYTGLRIRGTDMTRINVTLNGIPYNEPESHEVYWVDLPDFASSLQNIQIQRGVGASTNGAAAFGASINMQTNKLSAESFARYDGSFGSFNTFKNTLSFGSGLIDNRWAFDGRLSKVTSDGFIDRAFSDLKSFFLSGAYFGKKSFVKFNVFSGKEITYQSWAGVPKDSLKTNRTYNPYTYSNQTDNYQQDHYQLFYSYEFNKKINLTTALHYTKGKGYYENYEDKNDPYIFANPHTSFADYGLQEVIIGNDTISKSNNINRKWLDNDFSGTTLSLNYDDHDKLKLTFGSSYNYYSGKHFGNVIWSEFVSNGSIDRKWYDNTGTRTEFNSFVKANYQVIEKLNLYADLQYRYVDYKISGIHDNLADISQRHFFSFLNPKAGAFIDINEKNNIYLSMSVSNREPNRSNYEDAENGVIPKPERLYDYEFGYNFHTNTFSAGANLYLMDYKDQLILTGKINNVGAPIMTNVSQSTRQGIEFVVAANLLKHLKWDANLTLSNNQIKDFTEYVDDWTNGGQIENKLGTTDIAFSPNIIGSNSFTYEIIKNFRIGINSKYVGVQYIDNTYNIGRSIDAYFVNNLLINYSFKTKYIKEIGINIMINNILNEEYETNAWVYRYHLEGSGYGIMNGYYPQAGINFLAGVSLRF